MDGKIMILIKIGKTIVRAIEGITDLILYAILFAALLFGGYSLWESGQVYQDAEAANYAPYRPAEDDTITFDELRAHNSEVIGWLTVNDTPIDYPVTQTDNNEKYISVNAMGEFALSGSIFLDYRNSPELSDRINILYGHFMEKKLMFGCLGDYTEQAFLDSHQFGNLFCAGEDHGLEFFALVLTDAYDRVLYDTELETDEQLAAYLSNVKERALTWIEPDLHPGDRLLVLSTCATRITNGRYLLIGRFTKDLHLQTEAETPPPPVRRDGGTDRPTLSGINSLPVWIWGTVLAVLVILLAAAEAKLHTKTQAGRPVERKEDKR